MPTPDKLSKYMTELTDLLASIDTLGEGTDLIGVQDLGANFTSSPKNLSNVLIELLSVVSTPAPGTPIFITPVTLYNVGTGGIGPTTFNISANVPAGATSAIFNLYHTGGDPLDNHQSSISVGGPYTVYCTGDLGSCLNVIVPINPTPSVAWQAGVNPGNTAKCDLVGYLQP